jgi:ABC-type xylose transport system permease subunit
VNDDSAGTQVTRGSGTGSTPVWFWVISVIALAWYLMDTSAFFMRVLMTEEAIKAMPENQQHLYRDMPLWVNIVFACEVFGGTLGCISLLLRKKWALPLFVISLLGVLAQTSNIWFLTDAVSAMGAPAVMMPIVAIIIGTAMVSLAKSAIPKGWLR